MKRSKQLSNSQLKKAINGKSMYHHSKRKYKFVYVGFKNTIIQFDNGSSLSINVLNDANICKYLTSMCKNQKFIFDFSTVSFVGTMININGIDFGSFSTLYTNDIPDRIVIDKHTIRKIAKALN